MLHNYLKIALRNLLRQKAFSFINLAGLATGMACSILILLWVQDEWSFDRFHPNAKQLYRITSKVSDMEIAYTSSRMAAALPVEIPSLAMATRIKSSVELIAVGNQRFEEKRVFYADSTFLHMFNFPYIQGRGLTQPDGVLLTEQTAQKYFGTSDAVGKTIQILPKTIEKDNWQSFVVTGVLKNIPHNSHLQFDLLFPISFLEKSESFRRNYTWDSFTLYTYLQVEDRFEGSLASIQEMEQKINDLYRRNEPDMQALFTLQPLTNIHLQSSAKLIGDFEGHGSLQYVKIFLGVAIVILLIACINFTNLSTARSAHRAKEVGLRKVIGAKPRQLVSQFLCESFVSAIVAQIIAVVLAFNLLPVFNFITGKAIILTEIDPHLIVGLFGVTLLTGFLAGAYPAFVLAGFQLVHTLKGKPFFIDRPVILRNGLIVLQFATSIVLLIGTVIVYTQLHFIQSYNLGFDKANLLYLPMPSSGDLVANTQSFKSMLNQYPEIGNHAILSELPVNLNNGITEVEWEGKDPNKQVIISHMSVDEGFVATFGVGMLHGRGFLADAKEDQSNFLVNEAALKLMDIEVGSAVGKPLKFAGKSGKIIGVVKDFNFKSVHQAVEPLILRFKSSGNWVVVRTQPGRLPAALRQLEKIFKELYPNHPFSYNFLDEELARSYRSEQRMSYLFNVFSGVSLLVSCLGLFGLVSFLTERRTKEIGVRKVLGASVSNITSLLLKDTVSLLIVALLVAVPTAWWIMQQWLEGYAYRIEIKWWMMTLAGGVAVSVALITVSFQSVKAALMNPVKSLRSE